jgi:hypothetical protein
MKSVFITPAKTHVLPFSLEDEPQPDLLEAMAVAGKTAEMQFELGASVYATSPMRGVDLPTPPELSQEVAAKTKQLFKDTKSKKGADPRREALKDRPVALAAAAFLKSYGTQLSLDVATTRAAITAKLMVIADCGDPKYELRALELLGKHSDIGLFTERSEVTINYKSPEALEDAIKERVRRLLHSEQLNTINITPTVKTLEEELRGGFEVVASDDFSDIAPVVKKDVPAPLSDLRWGKTEGEDNAPEEGAYDFEDDDAGD